MINKLHIIIFLFLQSCDSGIKYYGNQIGYCGWMGCTACYGDDYSSYSQCKKLRKKFPNHLTWKMRSM